MACYIVNRNAQDNGQHEVHTETCTTLPDLDNRIPLGSHTSCHGAVAKAKTIFPTADGCANCCPDCNTG
ncbi:hypothetical protein BEN30_08925 [Magnetovibrio blakemorei]|uniref:Uncharacterized protein n=1 Tax=Magnetovibrio blakemorei TaxID=28181 RepID=A0A1E5Q871_9PROT|nr:hypothetical protein BEN30_08925 [Magnetovibrio blakemorei]